MSTISKDTNRNNLGGNYRIEIILFHDLFKIEDAINGQIPGFQIFDNSFVIDIECTIESIEDIINKKRSKIGTIYEVSINGQIPKTRIAVRNQLEELDNKKFVVILYDNNDNIRLFGDLKNPMRFDDDTDKRGRKASDINAYQFSFNGSFTYRPFYVKTDYDVNYVSPVFQHIFDEELDNTSLVLDSSDFLNHAYLRDAACLNMQKDGFIQLPADINFTGYTIEYSGTASLSLDIPNKKIICTLPGTVYELKLLGAQNYTFPCCEGDLDMLHDIIRGERAFTKLTSWSLQSQYFYLKIAGGTEIKSLLDTSKRLFVPYNNIGGKVYNGKADNKWYPGIDYKLNMIVKYSNAYYYCKTEHTSNVWSSETAKWTAL
jgi:hypothetical protein